MSIAWQPQALVPRPQRENSGSAEWASTCASMHVQFDIKDTDISKRFKYIRKVGDDFVLGRPGWAGD
jgi:hypothetical protein